MTSLYVGVDGCPAGWFSVGYDDGGGCDFGVYATFEELARGHAGARVILVDIPIGLPEGPGGRDCDREARRLLGRRGSSVFPTPTRQMARVASDGGDYRLACETEHQITGKKISQQTFAIARKIDEVDRFLLARGHGAKPRVRETHPEVCLWALNDRVWMRARKKIAAGRRERLDAISRMEPRAEALYEEASAKYRRKDVGSDDIIDALAAALTAYLPLGKGLGELRTLPERPPCDPKGKRMEMGYWSP